MKKISIAAVATLLCVPALALFLLSSLSALAANEALYEARAERPQYIAYRSFAKQLKMTGTFAEMGIPTRCFFAANTIKHNGTPYCEYPLIWKNFNSYDWSAFEAQADDLVKASPNADFLVMIDLNTPYWATHKFWLDSFTLVSHAASDRDWIAKTTVWMTNFIAHAEAKYAGRIRAYILSGGGTSEWYEYDRGFTSAKKDAAWRAWQTRHGVDFGPSVPPQPRLSTAAFENLVYDPATEGDKIAYWKFHNGVIADALLAFAKAARAAVPRTKEVGAFFGYYLVSDTKHTSFGHLDYERVYASPDLDFFIAPGNYSDRGMGGGSGSQLAMGTALANGKRFFHEIDFGPHTQRIWMNGTWKTLADDIAGNTREAAFAIANQSHSWWFDMWGGANGFYDQIEVRERIAQLKRIQDARKGDASPSGAQILIVADPESIYGVNEKDAKERGFGQHLRNMLSTSGATFDVFSFGDLAKLDLSQYRLICLNSTILITPERAKFLKEKVCTDGRTILWLYAPGLSDGQSLDVARVKDWAGVAFKTPGISTTVMSPSSGQRASCPLTASGDWTSVYAYDYKLYTTEALIGILERAGVHRYVKEPLCVYANETFVSVHTKEGGRKTVYLPKKAAKVVDLLTDEVVATDTDRFEANFASPDTKLFGLEFETTECSSQTWLFRKEGDATWRSVVVPHDWAIGGAFEPTKHDITSGALPYYGKGIYERTYNLATDSWLEFGGVMSEATVAVDGETICRRPYGYASFRVPIAKGRHVVTVTVEPKKDSSRWYPGAGLYRPVRVVPRVADEILPEDVFITTPEVTKERATVKISWPGGEKTFTVDNPRLWSPETPYLYTLDFGGRTYRYGIRTLAYNPTKGFFLNGVHRQMKGVCLHHDFGALGAAWNEAAARRQISLLKEIGCDAIRTSHNPPAPELLDLCDELGMMVLDEAFDMWIDPKMDKDYSRFFPAWHVRDLTDFICRDRNHPCVVMWSTGNEIVGHGGGEKLANAIKAGCALKDIVHRLDSTRPVTVGAWQRAALTNGFACCSDVFGANYLPADYAFFATNSPAKGIIGTETCSTVSIRGGYREPRCVGYDWSWPHENDYPPDVEFAAQEAHPYVYGEFVWTGFDYLGEPDPCRQDDPPARSAYFGIFDLCGFPKDRAWLYKAQWRKDIPIAHILPHWNWKEGEKTWVHVYSNGDEAELFLNGVSLGRKCRRKGESRFRWEDVAFRPGEISVKTWKAGRLWAEDRRVTAGAPAQLKVEREFAWGDTVFVRVSVLDRDGTIVPEAANRLTFAVRGGVELAGVCNGDPKDQEPFHGRTLRAFNGLCQVVLKRDAKRSAGRLIVSAAGLPDVELAVANDNFENTELR